MPGRLKDRLRKRLFGSKGKRRFIHHKPGVAGFFAALKKAGVTYSVLRWFETLPEVAAGEDIDILVADEDLALLDRFLTGSKPKGIPCDIYTVSGLPGTSYRGIAYFPAHLANELLATTVWQNGLVRVPDPRHHLFSMIYHVVYHKGHESGFPADNRSRPVIPTKPDHDYREVLTRCAEKGGISLPELTLDALDRFLCERNWNPSRDALEKLSLRNPWIHERYFAVRMALGPEWSGFSVFLVRDRGLPHLDYIRKLLENEGFDILYEQEITGDARENAVRNLRGGNWNRGPWPVSGGLPARLLAVNDLLPLEPDDFLKSKHPGLENKRLLDAKTRIRDAVNVLYEKKKWSNVIHSADNPRQGLEYLETAAPSKTGRELIEKKLIRRAGSLTCPYPVVSELPGHERRALVQLIEYKGRPAVCKVYRPGRERFLEREILARDIGRVFPEMAPLLEYGKDYMVLPFYDDVFDRTQLMPVSVLKRIMEILVHFRKAGYEMIDFKPKNIIMDRMEGLKIIDFEFLQKGREASSSLKGNWCWYGIPDNFAGDVPLGKKSRVANYKRFWFELTGVPLFMAAANAPLPVLALYRFSGSHYFFFRMLWRETKILLKVMTGGIKRAVKAVLFRFLE